MNRPLCTQIAAARRCEPAVRRIVALDLLHRMLRAGGPVAAHTALNWGALGSLLGQCSIDLHPNPHAVPPIPGDQDRVDWFSTLSRDAHALADQMRREVAGRRPGRGTPRAQRMPRTWRPSGRVIDMATVTVGAS